MNRNLIGILSLVVMSLALNPFVNCAQATNISGSSTADNAFFAYISTNDATRGTLVASGNSWGTTFTFSSIVLTPGVTSYLHIEAINYGGGGAYIGDFTLSDAGFHFANGTQNLLTDTSHWTGGYNNSNSNPNAQQPWVVPAGGVYSDGANGVSPWGLRSGISASALWIWPSDSSSATCKYCTVDFSTPITPANVTPEPGTLVMLGSGMIGLAGLFRRKRMP